jgi:hypothetical protein
MQCNDGEDGLNDAGALAQSSTISENVNVFSPVDAILEETAQFSSTLLFAAF